MTLRDYAYLAVALLLSFTCAAQDKPPKGWTPFSAGLRSYTTDMYRSDAENMQFHWNRLRKCYVHGHVADPELDNPFTPSAIEYHLGSGKAIKEVTGYSYHCIRCDNSIDNSIMPLRRPRPTPAALPRIEFVAEIQAR